VLCDIALPWMDGYGIARTIRQDAELKDVYLIAISGYAEDEDQQLADRSDLTNSVLSDGSKIAPRS
jgi:CheY-like chemotaxis protein